MDTSEIIQKYYKTGSEAYWFLMEHSKMVAKKALEIGEGVPHLNPDLKFIKEAAMLHDIGMFLTDAPEIGCFGDEPYIKHGYLGGVILKKEGFPKHALVCERHTGTGLSTYDIKSQSLPLPKRNMLPISIEEQIVCLADKFFSKNKKTLIKEKSIKKIKVELSRYGMHKVAEFDKLVEKFCFKSALAKKERTL